MLCPRCHGEITDDMRYCPHCGMKIEKCDYCHQPIDPKTKYCSYCGHEIYKHHESQINGYYQPIQDDTLDQQKTHSSFKDIEVDRTVHKKTIIISVLALAIITIISYIYIRTPIKSIHKAQSPSVQETKPIEGDNLSSTMIGNVNQGGEVFQGVDALYLCDLDGQLVKTDLDFTNQNVLLNEKCQYIQVVSHVIYYTNGQYQLCSMDTSGKQKQTLIEDAVYYVVVKDDKIYYQLDKDNESIYVFDCITQKSQKLNDRHSYNINVLDKNIYYTSEDGVYCMDLDGQNDVKISDGQTYNLIYQEGKLYSLSRQGQIMSYDVESKESEVLVDSARQLINIAGDDLFYLDSRYQLHHLTIKKQKDTVIYQGYVQKGYVLSNQLVIYAKDYSGQCMIVMDFNGDNQQTLFVEDTGNYI